ncbi:sulfurtransferase TusA family protein [Lichenibacterium minor]|uniref:Sulfurtransferase TusA family protein n=2 Tax=Lichenibacterium minor TaxID=2316528 RepID=A0A4V1RV01_9HYPH|nr:sulfurtransferase TusA family protein [Lichenibacterium minor]
MLYQLSYSGVSEPVRAATEGLIRRGSGLVQGLLERTVDKGERSGTGRHGTARARTAAMDEERAMAEAAPETLDLRGLKCPLPVLHVRRALGRLPPGGVILVRCTDPLASLDIPNLVRETGDMLVGAARDGRESQFTVRKT